MCNRHQSCPKYEANIVRVGGKNTGIACFFALDFIVLCRQYILYRLKVCGNSAEQVYSTTFPTVFAYLVSLCHIFVILVAFNLIIIYVMVIRDQ